jgi:hypothetical protein
MDFLNLSLEYLSLVNNLAQGLGTDIIRSEFFHETASILSTDDTSSEAFHSALEEHLSTSHPDTEETTGRMDP